MSSSRTFYTRKVLEIPYNHCADAREIREFLAGVPDSALVNFGGGDDFSDGHTFTVSIPRPATLEERTEAVMLIKRYRATRLRHQELKVTAEQADAALKKAIKHRESVILGSDPVARDSAIVAVWHADDERGIANAHANNAYAEEIRAQNNMLSHYNTYFTDGVR